MVADADDLDADFIHPVQSLSGPLSITIAREVGLACLKSTLFAVMRAPPDIDVTVDFDDRSVDFAKENHDLGVRIASAKLTGRESQVLGTTRHGLYAGQGAARTDSLPRSLGELSTHPLLYYGAARRARWDFLCDGKKRQVTVKPALISNTGPFLPDAALADMGIIRLPDFMV